MEVSNTDADCDPDSDSDSEDLRVPLRNPVSRESQTAALFREELALELTLHLDACLTQPFDRICLLA